MRNACLIALAVLFALGTLASRSARGYPIPPQTLWEVAKAADLVVLAEVSRVTDNPACKKRDDCFLDGSIAWLEVRETWKGAAPVGPLQVFFEPNMICPAPPRYVRGETVVAFLGRHPEKEGWTTVSLSYGSRPASGSALDDLRQLTQSALALQAQGRIAPEKLLEWSVEAASHLATRWDGLYLLRAAADRMHSYYDTERQDETAEIDRAPLSQEQLRRIARAFVVAPPAPGELALSLAVLEGFVDPAVDRTAVALMEGVLAGEGEGWAYEAKEVMPWVLRRFGGQDVEQRWPVLAEDSFPESSVLLRQVWEEARKAFEIPKVPPLVPGAAGAQGVGGRTPD